MGFQSAARKSTKDLFGTLHSVFHVREIITRSLTLNVVGICRLILKQAPLGNYVAAPISTVMQPVETAADTGSATARCAGGTAERRSSHRRNRLHS